MLECLFREIKYIFNYGSAMRQIYYKSFIMSVNILITHICLATRIK